MMDVLGPTDENDKVKWKQKWVDRTHFAKRNVKWWRVVLSAAKKKLLSPSCRTQILLSAQMTIGQGHHQVILQWARAVV